MRDRFHCWPHTKSTHYREATRRERLLRACAIQYLRSHDDLYLCCGLSAEIANVPLVCDAAGALNMRVTGVHSGDLNVSHDNDKLQ
jgi:hypothetical protein